MSQSTTAAETGALLYTIEEAADLLAISRWSVYALADDGRLPSVYQGRRRYIAADGLRAYVASLSSTPLEG